MTHPAGYDRRWQGQPAPTVEINAEQIAATLELVKENPELGTIRALRQAGVKGSKGQLHKLVDEELEERLRLARGWNIVEVEDTTWKVAADPTHPNWDRANSRVLRAYHPAYRDHQTVTHEGEVRNPDIAGSLDRLNQILAAAAVRASTRTGADDVPGEPDGPAAGRPRLAVAGVARPS